MTAALLGALLAASPALHAGEFLKNMRKAEKRKELPERLEYFTRAIRAWVPEDGQPLLANSHFRRGEALYHLDRLKESEPDLDRSLELDPLNTAAHLLRGRLRLLLGKAEPAVADLRAAAGVGEGAEAWVLLGEAHAKAGRSAQSLEAYARAERAAPQDHRPALGRARLKMRRQDWEGALEELSRAQTLARRSDPEVYSEAAVCETAQGRHPRALERYDEAVSLHERPVRDAERGAVEPLEARRALERAAKAYFGRGRVLEFLLKRDEALADYEEACRLGHAPACARADALKLPDPEARARRGEPERAKPVAEEPERPRKRRRLRTPESDSGDRIYAN